MMKEEDNTTNVDPSTEEVSTGSDIEEASKLSLASDNSPDADADKLTKVPGARVASVSETLSFLFECGQNTVLLFLAGVFFSVAEGVTWPALAFFLSRAYSGVVGAADGMDRIWDQVTIFAVLGSIMFLISAMQSVCLEMVSRNASQAFRKKWFRALVRQDMAYFDVHGGNEVVSSLELHSDRYRKGVGKKFGMVFGSLVKALLSVIWGFVSSWKVSLVVLFGVLPIVTVSTVFLVRINQAKSVEAARAYKMAGKVALSTLASIRTILSLNAVTRQINLYATATLEAYKASSKRLWKQGFAAGSMVASMMILFMVVTLFGSYVIYSEVEDTGCDPSDAIPGQLDCVASGPAVFRVMFFFFFAADGLSGTSTALEAFNEARIAAGAALETIERTTGSEEQVIFDHGEKKTDLDASIKSDLSSSRQSSVTKDERPKIKGILPKYEIDSTSTTGAKPEYFEGKIAFRNVDFAYPSRPQAKVLTNFSFDIEQGKVVAFVGPSGSGKSTLCALIERFYDPLAGSVLVDDIDLKEMNLTRLRHLIGYVGQEPVLFATTIAENIRFGNLSATQEEIETAAKLCNAHDFIMGFPNGYDTNVSDGGAQLSGGQKQRIAIARVLVANPSILLLDEATSALDNDSERLVQSAIDNVLAVRRKTTIVIAHRLSTIRNADLIAVLDSGVVKEIGSHDELMKDEGGIYRALVEKQVDPTRASIRRSNTEVSQTASPTAGGNDSGTVPLLEFKDVHFSYPSRPENRILKGLNLSIQRGDIVAICGPSGQGKSTLMALIERFYDADDGSVLYKGKDVSSLNVHWYRDQIGYVGQEPTLFNDTIANNIAYGTEGATKEEIEEAARDANAEAFILSLPDGYDTMVGDKGSQMSGGQKQRLAIARALIKKPKLILLDEATSALDSTSEALVQEALDKLLETRHHTCVMIAHRLSTVRQADKIAYVADGKVKEFGSHDDLMARKGLYYSLVEATSVEKMDDKKSKGTAATDDIESVEDHEVKNAKTFKSRAWELARPDIGFIVLGFIGALFSGSVFPFAGLLYGKTIGIFFTTVLACSDDSIPGGFETCDDYWEFKSNDMQEQSFRTAVLFALNAGSCVFGNVLAYKGFGTASERLAKRIRDKAFGSLVRQECAFFDEHRVGSLASQLQQDAALLHNFVGEPIRSLTIAMSAIVIGTFLSLYFMWPFGLVSIAFIPLVAVARVMYAKQSWGIEGSSAFRAEGSIILETLGNMKTISALAMEDQKINDFENALAEEDQGLGKQMLALWMLEGYQAGISRWVNAAQFGWGGWLLFTYPEKYIFTDFVYANLSMVFASFGLGVAFSGLGDKKETDDAAERLFALLDRQSSIDPLSEDGLKLEDDGIKSKSDLS
eukprot:Nitzschia sp. Nitz4//scaffold153_size53422//46055//50256//NITZ4_006766-RA/size53422-snap-gene-0.60-mRNA-1//-1//CDS//3329537277//5827//frame0